MSLRTTAAIAALCAPMIAAGGASAQGITWSYGVDVTSNYISEGVSQTNGKAAVQPWVEAAIGDFYFGTWMSNVDFGAGTSDSWEADFYAGYSADLGAGLTYDIGYVRYFYNKTGNAYGELTNTLSFAASDRVDLTGFVAYDPDSRNWQYRGELAYALNDALSFDGHYGHSDLEDHNYWRVGGTYALNDSVAFDVSYNGSDKNKDEGWVAMVNFAF